MWQEILALDSKACDARLNKMSSKDKKDLKSLYLKRRLQLLPGPASNDIDRQTEEQEEAARIREYFSQGQDYQPVVRNRKYISLRVKLLKRQFGLPSEVLSLRSLSLRGSNGPMEKHSTQSGTAFSRVHHIFDSLHSSQITRLMFIKAYLPSHENTVNNNVSPFRMLSSSLDGSLSVTNFSDFENKALPHPSGVLDFDLSALPYDLLVTACTDGTVILWHFKSGKELRRLQAPSAVGTATGPLTRGARVTAVRFLPTNNNLVVCATNGGLLRLLNVSTGKFLSEGCGHTTGKVNCLKIYEAFLWTGSDRGYIESFKIESLDQGGKVLKGCRTPIQQQVQQQQPVTSLSASKDGAMVLATTRNSPNLFLFKVVDQFGSVLAFKKFNAGTYSSSLMCGIFATSSTSSVCGSSDGSVLMFDLEKSEKPCVDKLLGHSKPVSFLTINDDGSFLISADTSGQIIIWEKP